MSTKLSNRHVVPASTLMVLVLGCILGCVSANLEPVANAEEEPMSSGPVASPEGAVPVVQDQDQDPSAAQEQYEEEVESPSEEFKPVIEPEADEILRAMAEYLGTAQSFIFHAEVTTEEVVLTNLKIQTTASVAVGLRRPNGLYAQSTGDVVQRRTWFDGETFTALDGIHNVYGQLPVDISLDKTMRDLRQKYGAQIPLSFFLFRNPYKEMMTNAKYGFYIGIRDVQGTRCHHLLYVSDEVNVQFWIEAGAQYVPRKLVINYKNEHMAPQFTAIFTEWNFNPRLSTHLFKAKLPSDAIKIEFAELKQKIESMNSND